MNTESKLKIECPDCKSTIFTMNKEIYETLHWSDKDWIFNSADCTDQDIYCGNCGTIIYPGTPLYIYLDNSQ